MTRYSSSSIALADSKCSYALEQREQSIPYDRSIFSVGIAAHAVLQAVCNATSEKGSDLDQPEVERVADETVAALIAHGRVWNGEPEPPLPITACLEGRALAVAYLATWWPRPSGRSELGVAVDRQWRPVSWDSPDVWLCAILDYVSIEELEEEEGAALALIVHDFKSSWVADASELDTIQRKIHTLLAAICLGTPEIGLIRTSIGNLRTWKTHSLDVLAPFGADESAALGDDTRSDCIVSETLLAWKREIEVAIAGLDAQLRPRPASPGVNCLGCEYVLTCVHARDYMERTGMHQTPELRARAYAVAIATAEALEVQVRADCEEGEQKWSIDGTGGTVGWIASPKRSLSETASAELVEAWEAIGGESRGLVKALQPSVTSAEKVAKILFPDRKQKSVRDDFVSSLVVTEMQKKFGIRRGSIDESPASE